MIFVAAVHAGQVVAICDREDLARAKVPQLPAADVRCHAISLETFKRVADAMESGPVRWPLEVG